MKFDNQLRYAITVIDTYKGEMPLHAWLKNYFRDNKQMGSRDRRLLSTLVYSFYRLGHAVRDLPVKERLLAGFFLCQDQPQDWLGYFDPALNDAISLPLEQKLELLQSRYSGFRPTDIFPWADELSDRIDHRAFCHSFLRQPDLFLRIRPGHEKAVLRQLPQGEFMPPFTVRLPNGFKVEELFTPDVEVVVQDYSSQRIAEFLKPGFAGQAAAMGNVESATAARPVAALGGEAAGAAGNAASAAAADPASFWDACAASGGKSILAHDLYPDMKLTVSDIRPSILHNLKQRFARAGIREFNSFITDLSQSAPPADAMHAQLILADVPCTGSGTWSRTPEELYFFRPEKIAYYTAIQKKIILAIAQRLTAGTRLVYSTCSVFKSENEAIVKAIPGLELEKMENLMGYELSADTMFAASFTR